MESQPLPQDPAPADRPGVLIEIGHPAHVHFFRGAIAELKRRGVAVHLITRNKDITDSLLDRFGLEYISLSRPARTKLGLMVELMRRWWATYRILKKKRIGVSASISGITTAVPSRLAGVRTLSFTDTEDATISNRIAMPYSDRILTPEFYRGDFGKPHERYLGLHELAYLQDFDFEKAAQVRHRLGLDTPYVLIRRVANDAVHDWQLKGFTPELLEKLRQRLSTVGKVFISSEGPLPDALQPYRLNIPLEDIHGVLAGAELFVGESPTMAVEASLLGTPAFLLSERVQGLGNMMALEEKQLLVNCQSFEELERALGAITDLKAYGAEWEKRAALFRRGAVPMSRFIADAILKEL